MEGRDSEQTAIAETRSTLELACKGHLNSQWWNVLAKSRNLQQHAPGMYNKETLKL